DNHRRAAALFLGTVILALWQHNQHRAAALLRRKTLLVQVAGHPALLLASMWRHI
ncbi:Hypothetical predicted protein, partial [Pelobates cultripes]